MSKRDTFLKNIMALTRCRSFKKAVAGWDVDRIINLPQSGPQASCRLCGTHFRSGAMVQHPLRTGSRQVTIAIGGDCLETILLARFADRRVVAVRKRATTAAIKNIYQSLIDPGAWIKWIVGNAPRRLAAIVADLQRLGMVSSDDELRKLIAFHDRTCMYPRAALIPDWRVLEQHVGKIPQALTLHQARLLISRLTAAALERILLARAEKYYNKNLKPLESTDKQWSQAWNELDALGRRMVIALCSLTANTLAKKKAGEYYFDLLPLPTPVPTFALAWHPRAGIGIVEHTEVYGDGMVTVGLLRDGRYRPYKLSYWLSVLPRSAQTVRRAELLAFWTHRNWFKGLPLEKKLDRLPAGRAISEADPPDKYEELARGLDKDRLMRHFRMKELLSVARVRLHRKGDIVDWISWVRTQLEDRGISWSEWLWRLHRYSADVAAKERVDGLATDIW